MEREAGPRGWMEEAEAEVTGTGVREAAPGTLTAPDWASLLSGVLGCQPHPLTRSSTLHPPLAPPAELACGHSGEAQGGGPSCVLSCPGHRRTLRLCRQRLRRAQGLEERMGVPSP